MPLTKPSKMGKANIDDLKSPNEKKGKFRFANSRVLLTYKTHIDKADLKAYIASKCGGQCEIMEIYSAHETGDKETPYDHTHTFVKFSKTFQSRNCRIFDYGGIHPHIKLVTTNKHEENVMKYLAKEDSSNEDLLYKKTNERVSEILAAQKPTDAAKKSKDISEAYLTMRMNYEFGNAQFDDSWNSSEGNDVIDKGMGYSWQRRMIATLSGKPARRGLIYWIYDAQGQNGKTTFAAHCRNSDPKHHILLSRLGDSRDVAETILTEQKRTGFTGRCFHINLSRDDFTNVNYNTLEQIADSEMMRTKYNGGKLNFRSYYTIVYANWPPDWYKLSDERWRVFKLVRNEGEKVDVVMQPMSKAKTLRDRVEAINDWKYKHTAGCEFDYISKSEEQSEGEESDYVSEEDSKFSNLKGSPRIRQNSDQKVDSPQKVEYSPRRRY